MFEPYSGYHLAHLQNAGLIPVLVPFDRTDWSLDMDRLPAAIEPTSALVINTPGKVFTREEPSQIGELASRHNLWLFTDEIYQDFIYEGAEHPAAVPGLRQRTVTIGGFSKNLATTGWRVGDCAAPSAVAVRLASVRDLFYVCAPAPRQYGVAQGLKRLGQECFSALGPQFQRKREQLCAALASAGFPAGEYYVLPDNSLLPGATGPERTADLLERTGVAAVSAEAFFPSGGECYARFCFARRDPELNEACQRLQALRTIQTRNGLE